MASTTKKITVVRWKYPARDLYDVREITAKQFRDEQGIHTQNKDVVFRRQNGFALRADEAEISKEALEFFRNSSEFAVEEQEVNE